ncbi:MAG: hypothetical protein AAGA77_06185 [Bacteroidota bacterium]
MKLNCLLLSIFISLFYVACKSDTVPSNDYSFYHQQTTNAETWISQEEYQKALSVYDDLIAQYDFVFLREYKIAAQLSLYIGEEEKAITYLKKGIANGWKLQSLKKDDFIANRLSASQWQNLEEENSTLHSRFLQRIDLTLKALVKSMIDADQKIALQVSQIENEENQEEIFLKYFAPQSKKHLQKTTEILEESGYPGEQLIGNNFWMSTILSHHNSIAFDFLKNDSLYPNIRPKLFKELKQGRISPYELSLIEDWRIAVSSEREGTGYGYVVAPKRNNLTQVNQKRKEIGLRPVELRNTLVDIERKTGMNFYLPDWIDDKIAIENE